MKLEIPNDVVFRGLAGEAVILNLATGTYFGLDSIGTRIWHLIAENGSTDKIVEEMLAEYEAEEAEIRRDLEELIRQLAEKGLVRIDAKEAPTAP